MPYPLRHKLFLLYTIIAVIGPLLAVIFPGEPPLGLNQSLLEVKDGRFVHAERALGEGADSYEYNVVTDLENRITDVSANYPDGSSALMAQFTTDLAALTAANRMKKLIPHTKDEETDLWSTHFVSDSGEFILMTLVENVYVLIIADTEGVARERLSALPAIIVNQSPGLGAVLSQMSGFLLVLSLVFYGLIQALLIANLKRWATPPPQTSPELPVASRSSDDD